MGPGGRSLLSLPKGQGLGQYGSVDCFKFLWFGWFLLHWIPGQKGSPRWNLWDKPSPRAAVRVRLKCSEYGRRQSSSRLQLSCPAVYHSWLLVHIQGLSQLRPWLKVCGNSTTSRKSCHRLPVAFRGLQARATLVSSEQALSGEKCRLTRLALTLAWPGRCLAASVPYSGLDRQREGLWPPGWIH